MMMMMMMMMMMGRMSVQSQTGLLHRFFVLYLFEPLRWKRLYSKKNKQKKKKNKKNLCLEVSKYVLWSAEVYGL